VNALDLSARRLSAAMTTGLAARLAAHVTRPDAQEDLCFALWNPRRGAIRTTAVLSEAILPEPGARRCASGGPPGAGACG
jgi:hypothetical protein